MKAEAALQNPGDVARRESCDWVAIWAKGTGECVLLNGTTALRYFVPEEIPEWLPGDDWQPLHPAGDGDWMARAYGAESVAKCEQQKNAELQADLHATEKKLFETESQLKEANRIIGWRDEKIADHAAEVKRLTAERDEAWEEARRESLRLRSAMIMADDYAEKLDLLAARVAELESGSAFVGEEIKPGDFCADGELIYYLPATNGDHDTLLAKECEGSAIVSEDGRIRYRCTFPPTAPLPTAGDEEDDDDEVVDGERCPDCGEYIEWSRSVDEEGEQIPYECECHQERDTRPIIKRLRLLAHYGMREFAERCGIPPSHWYAIETGDKHATKEQLGRVLVALADGLYSQSRPAPAEPDSPAEERRNCHPVAPKPSCLDGVPAVLCEYKHKSWERSCGIEYWVYGPIFDGKVAGVRGDSYLGEGLQGVYVSELTPIHHDPTDPAAVELAGRIERGGSNA